MPPTLPDHLRACLGEIESGRRFTPDDAQVSIDIVRFPDQPMPGAATYTTVGLSKVLLHEDSGHIRQELLYAQEGERESYEAAYVLADTAERALDIGRPLPRGQVLGPAGPVLDGSELEAFICLNPGYFSEGLELYEDPSQDVPVLIVMLAPIAPDEALFVRRHGVDAFEDLFQAEDLNLLDWRRAPLLRWVATSGSCPDCGQSDGHFHLPDGRLADE